MEVKKITLDKMTIVGNLNSELSYALQNAANEPHVYIKGSSTKYIEGKFFSFGYSESVYFCYDAMNSQSMGKRSFRMEFNPSKMTVEQSEWLKSRIIYILDDIGITRLDLAFDCDFDLSTFSFEYSNALKSNEIRSRTGKIETMYFGSRNSNLFYRIYDKKVELKDKQNILISDPILWRYEVEIKNADIIDKMIEYKFPLFDNKRIIQYGVDSLSVNDNLMITGLLIKPQLMDQLSKNSRTKYRKMMKNLDGIDVTPLFVKKLDEKKPELISEINSWLGKKY